MKPFQTILILLFLLNSLTLLGQSNFDTLNKKEKPWTVGVIAFSIPDFFNNYISMIPYKNHLHSGIVVQKQLKYFNIRAALEIERMNLGPSRQICAISTGYFKQKLIRFGIEKGIHFNNHFRPYLATEITGCLFNSDVHSIGLSGNGRQSKTNQVNYGFLQALGLQYFINQSISLSLESRIAFLQFNGTNDFRNLDLPSYNSSKQFSDFKVNYNPLSAFSFNVHF